MKSSRTFIQHIRHTIVFLFSGRILLLALVGGIILTALSVVFHQEQLAITTAGEFNAQDAARMGLTTRAYYGWPSIMFVWQPGIVSYPSSPINSLFGTIFANFWSLAFSLFTIVPNLVFWGSVSFGLLTLIRVLYAWFSKLFSQ